MKPRAELLAICDYASVSNDGKLSVTGIFRQTYIEEIPASLLHFYIAATIIADPDKKYRITISILGPDGKLASPREQAVLQMGAGGVTNLITDVVNMPIDQTGEYTIELTANKHLIGKSSFKIINISQKRESIN